eukprot:3979814-Pyramimonas_sp.AAC.1
MNGRETKYSSGFVNELVNRCELEDGRAVFVRRAVERDGVELAVGVGTGAGGERGAREQGEGGRVQHAVQ